MTEEELQSLDLMELKEQIKFQESTIVVASQDIDFCVKMDDNIHVHTALEVQSKELKKKKVIMIQESTMQKAVVVGVDEEHIVLVQSLYVHGNQSDTAMESLVMHGMGVVHPLA